MTRRDERGSAGLELVALLPLLLVVAMMVLQVGGVAYAASSAQEAARAAARAASLGQDPGTAARESLPSSLRISALSVFGSSGHGVRLTVDVPSVSVLPTFQVTREAELP